MNTEDSTTVKRASETADEAAKMTSTDASANRDRLAGLLGAGVALATTELLPGFITRIPSLIESIGEAVIDLSPGTLVKFGIRTFGTNDKPALAIGIIVICLVAGVFLGTTARKRGWLPPVAMSLVGLVGIAAAVRDPLASGGWAVVSVAVAVIAGSASIRFLLDLSGKATSPKALAEDRRRFVLSAAGGLGAVVILPIIGRRLAQRSTVEAARAAVDLTTLAPPTTLPPISTATTIEGLTPLFVPNDDFFRIDTAFTIPQVNPANWDLKITGMVDNELTFTYEELLARATTQADVTLSCVSNRVGGDLVGNARWTGVPLQELLEEAGVQPGGTQIMGRSVDNFSAGFPTSIIGDGRTALVAIGMNGEPLPTAHGFPARLVIAGVYGYVSATKWLKEIELNNYEAEHGYWITRGWSKEGPIKTQSRIDVPRARVQQGTVTVAGVAWAPTRGISKVEVRTDEGPWEEATIGSDLQDESWVQWWHDFDLAPGTYRVTVRATDGLGATQTDEIATPAPSGATGHHAKTITVA